MLKEWNERSRNRGNLNRSHIHEVHLLWSHNREVCLKTRLYTIVDKCAVIIQRRIALGNHFTLLDLGGHVNHFIIVDVNLSVLYNTIRSLDETEIIDLGIHAER